MDHALIIEKNSLKETTLEALKARISELLNLIFVQQRRIWQSIFMKNKKLGYNMKAVTVYETPVNSATYME